MKKTLLIFVVLIAVSSAVSARRMDKPEVASSMAVMKRGSLVKVFYKAGTENNVDVTIRNIEGKVVFTEEIKHVDGFMRPYNFSNLAEGEYTIELVDQNGKKIEKVSYRNGTVERLANVIHLAGEDDKYVLTISNKGKDTFSIKIYDSNDAVLYSDKEEVDGDFAKVFNLSKIKGKCTFEITDKAGNVKRINYE